jgi:hypothetical protein
MLNLLSRLSISIITLWAAKRAREGASDGQGVLTVGRRKGGRGASRQGLTPSPPNIEGSRERDRLDNNKQIEKEAGKKEG